MMDIEVPSIDINYDYMLELLITGEYKERLKGEQYDFLASVITEMLATS